MNAGLWIKQYGLQRSGTNYAKSLIEMSCTNVRVLATVLGSKHAAPDLENHVDMLTRGDVGIAITDLQPDDFSLICDAYRQRELAVLICVRDAVTWMDAYERHMARRENRDPLILNRDQLASLSDMWVNWIYSMTDWSAASGLRTLWAVHHNVVRNPQELLHDVSKWGTQCGPPADVGYTKKSGDHHGSENVTGRPYKARQYRDIYNGAGQIAESDIDWVCTLIDEHDTRDIARPFMWDRRPLKRKQSSS